MNDKLIVGIADMKLAQDGEKLVTYALGSCIGICLYEPNRRLAALIHIMLPLNMETGRKNQAIPTAYMAAPKTVWRSLRAILRVFEVSFSKTAPLLQGNYSKRANP